MKDATAKLLEKAGRAIAAGESSLRGGHTEADVSRSYYAMFHVAQSLLNERDLRFRKHGGVHSAFGEHFVKTGEFDPRYHRQFLAAFNKRIAADYGVEIELTASEVEEMLAQAGDFLDTTRRFLELRP
jgi:uncharacterized protein (UPF0332 family)